MNGFEAETWLIDQGHEIIEAKADRGEEALRPLDQLILYLWYTDYCMRNAGDLANLDDLCVGCLDRAEKCAAKLEMEASSALFSLRGPAFESEFFDRFDGVITELSLATGGQA